jgi:DNA-binding MarR family transcriptional regulator
MINNSSKSAEVVRLTKRLYILMNQQIDETLKAHGMARRQFQVLFHVRKNGELTQKELQNIMHVEPATLSGLTDVLERKGWLKRTEHPSDRRAKLLKLTASGQKVLQNIPNPALAAEKRMLSDLSPPDKAALKVTLEQIIKNLETK